MHKFFVFVALAIVMLMSSQTTASACSCLRGDKSEAVSKAEYIFVGTIKESKPSSDGNILLVEVQEVFKGNIKAETIEVFGLDNSQGNSAACIQGYIVGKKYIMNGSTSKAGKIALSSHSCDSLTTIYNEDYKGDFENELDRLRDLTNTPPPTTKVKRVTTKIYFLGASVAALAVVALVVALRMRKRSNKRSKK